MMMFSLSLSLSLSVFFSPQLSKLLLQILLRFDGWVGMDCTITGIHRLWLVRAYEWEGDQESSEGTGGFINRIALDCAIGGAACPTPNWLSWQFGAANIVCCAHFYTLPSLCHLPTLLNCCNNIPSFSHSGLSCICRCHCHSLYLPIGTSYDNDIWNKEKSAARMMEMVWVTLCNQSTLSFLAGACMGGDNKCWPPAIQWYLSINCWQVLRRKCLVYLTW